MHLFWDGVISTSFIDAVRVNPRNTTKGSLPEWALIGRRRGRHASSQRWIDTCIQKTGSGACLEARSVELKSAG